MKAFRVANGTANPCPSPSPSVPAAPNPGGRRRSGNRNDFHTELGGEGGAAEMTAGAKLGFVRTPLSTAARGCGMLSAPF